MDAVKEEKKENVTITVANLVHYVGKDRSKQNETRKQ